MSVMKLEYADDIYDIPYEEKDGLFHPTFENYGRKDMTPLEIKALDYLNEIDSTALDMVNISGLYLKIWKQIGRKAENVRTSTRNSLIKKRLNSQKYTEKAQIMTEIELEAQNSAWETIRSSVTWLAAEVRSRGKLTEIAKISMNMMSRN